MVEQVRSAEAAAVAALAIGSRRRLELVVERDSGEPARVPIEILVGASRRPCLALMAGVHGDEYDGIVALQEMLGELTPDGLAGSLIVVPVANPLALGAAQRRTPDDGKDLNRVFPGRPDGTVSDRLADQLVRLIRQADLVFTLHGAGSLGRLLPWIEFLNLPDFSGPATYEAARASGFRDLIALPRLPGTLQTELAKLGVICIEGEAGGRGALDRAAVDFYKARVRQIAAFAGVLLRGQQQTADEPQRIWNLGHVPAGVSGIFVRGVELSQEVVRGQRLGRVVSAFGETLAEVAAPADGMVGGVREHAGVQAESGVVTLWTPAELHAQDPG